MGTILLFCTLVLIAYLIGSISSAVIISRLCGLPDPRTKGSQNPGATNMLRLSGKKYAVIVLLFDILKGLVPLLIAQSVEASLIIKSFTCLAAVLGHIYPLYFHFKGGKGVATAIGALLGLHFMLGISIVITWIIVVKLTKYSSLASIVALLLAPFLSILMLQSVDPFTPLLMITLLIVYKHRANLTRLIDGTESKVNFKKQTTIE